jgi:hypothetical protein
VTSCCRRCEVSNVAAFFSVQSYLTVAPFAKIALAFEALGFSQCLDAYANDFGIDWKRKRFATFQRFADNHGGLLQSRSESRKDDRIEISLGDGFRKNNFFPPAVCIDHVSIGCGRPQIRVAGINRLQQFEMQRTNDLSKRNGEDRSICFIEGKYDLARSLDGVGSNEHVPLDFSGLRLVHASIRWFDLDPPAAVLSRPVDVTG